MSAFGAEGTAAPESYLRIEEIEGVEPLALQLGEASPKRVPDGLYALLFSEETPSEAEIAHYGSAETVPPLRTYAILDAGKMPYLLTSLLKGSGLQYQSLFQGEHAQELKERAPYLVELREDSDFTLRLMTSSKGINGLWDKELGIYIRSRACFAELRKHFRKFTRIQDQQGKWFLFRFWEPKNITGYFDSIAQIPEKIVQWFRMRDRTTIEKIIGIYPGNTGQVWCISPRWVELGGILPVRKLVLSNREMLDFRTLKIERFVHETTKWIQKIMVFTSKKMIV